MAPGQIIAFAYQVGAWLQAGLQYIGLSEAAAAAVVEIGAKLAALAVLGAISKKN